MKTCRYGSHKQQPKQANVNTTIHCHYIHHLPLFQAYTQTIVHCILRDCSMNWNSLHYNLYPIHGRTHIKVHHYLPICCVWSEYDVFLCLFEMHGKICRIMWKLFLLCLVLVCFHPLSHRRLLQCVSFVNWYSFKVKRIWSTDVSTLVYST